MYHLLWVCCAILITVQTRPMGSGNLINRLELQDAQLRRVKRSTLMDGNRLFFDRKVPYLLDSKYGQEEVEKIEAAMRKIESVSCVKFQKLSVQPSDNSDYVKIEPLQYCHSDIGRMGGQQTLALGVTCFGDNGKVILHELLHTLGFWHEHNRPDRDLHIRVNWEYITDGKKEEFQSLSSEAVNTFQLPYDYKSIMHYGPRDYSIDPNRYQTIVPVGSDVNPSDIGWGNDMTAGDKQKLNKLYNCEISECRPPEALDKVITQGSDFKVGSTVTFSCASDNLVLVGSRSRQCKYSGDWSGVPPQCLEKVLHQCSFEENTCGWSGDEWKRDGPGYTTPFTDNSGPAVDATIGTVQGHFLVALSRKKVGGETSTVTTPKIAVDADEPFLCLSFYFYLWGKNNPGVKVFVQKGAAEKQLLVQKSGNLGPKWLQSKLAITNTKEEVAFTFQAVFGDNCFNDVAIDEFVLRPCTQETAQALGFEKT